MARSKKPYVTGILTGVRRGWRLGWRRLIRTLRAHEAGHARIAFEHAGAVTDVSRRPSPGDPFPDLYDFADYSQAQVEHLFGPTQFAASVFSVPTGKWAGPFKSAYGWHLIHVQSRAAAREQSFATVRDKVRADYLLDSQKRANDSAFTTLARQFTVGRP